LKNKNIDFDKLIEIFNKDGKQAAKAFVEETYNSSYAIIQRRIKSETNYCFNRNTRKYEIQETEEPEFMSIEELYEGKSKPVVSKGDHFSINNVSEAISDSFKELMVNLMKDKMQELNKYFYLEQSTKQVVINIKKLEQNGYHVIIN